VNGEPCLRRFIGSRERCRRKLVSRGKREIILAKEADPARSSR